MHSACLYWCLDQHKCIAGIWLVPINEIANGCIKWLVGRARPGWVDPRVRMLAWSDEFSFPSSHAQLAAAVMHFFVAASSHAQATSITPAWAAYAYAAAVALSRVHVGVHYPSDVLVGAGCGVATAALYERLLPRLHALAPGGALALLSALSVPLWLAAVAVLLAYRRARSQPPDPPLWRRNACRGKYAGRPLDPRDKPLGLYTGMTGVLAGLAVGIAFKQFHPLALPMTDRASVARALIGNVGLMAMFEGVAAATPEKPLAVYTTLRFLKYALVPVYIIHCAPPIFEVLGI